MKAKQIFKASELVKQFSILASSVDHEDWHHVVAVHDIQADRIVLLSYIWDTREITHAVTLSLGTDEYEAVLQLLNDAECKCLANDSLKYIKCTTYEQAAYMDYVSFVNKEVMATPVKLTIKSSKSAIADDKYLALRDYTINGNVIATLYRTHKVSADKTIEWSKELHWHEAEVAKLFGTMPADHTGYTVYAALKVQEFGDKTSNKTVQSAINQKLIEMFSNFANIKF